MLHLEDQLFELGAFHGVNPLAFLVASEAEFRVATGLGLVSFLIISDAFASCCFLGIEIFSYMFKFITIVAFCGNYLFHDG